MALGLRRWLALSTVAVVVAGCGSDDGATGTQCLLTTDEAAAASGLPVSSAEAWDQEASGAGPACLYTDDDGNRLNLSWRASTKADIADARQLQAENAALFELRDEVADGAFLGANGIPSVFVPTPTDHLIVVEMLDGLEFTEAAVGLASAAAERCCP